MEAALSNGKHWVLLPRVMGRGGKFAVLLLITVLTSCAPATFQIAHNFQQPSAAVRVLLMQPDVQLAELTAGGLEEPRADWTAAAMQNVTKALTDFLKEREDTLILYRQPEGDQKTLYLHDQLIKLHETVGETILLHKYIPYYELPTKSKTFDWNLGKGGNSLREQYGADYALFVYLRDSYVSPGRAVAMAAAAILGVSIRGGLQIGFASLVDLRNGQLVWFNKLFRPTGDLRTPEPAREAVQQLLIKIPL